MVQNYAWTHRNPARYHSTTRLIIIPLYFFCLEVRSFRRSFFPVVPVLLLSCWTVWLSRTCPTRRFMPSFRTGDSNIADMSDMCCQFVEQNFVESFFDILRYWLIFTCCLSQVWPCFPSSVRQVLSSAWWNTIFGQSIETTGVPQ